MEEKRITNICTFYVSEWHLATLLLAFLNRKINKAKIVTFLEEDIKEIENLAVKLRCKKELLDINWTKINETKYTNISKILNKNMAEEQIIIIYGNINFIKKVKENVDFYFNENRRKLDELNAKIKIISCYGMGVAETKEVLDCNDKVLNTSGEVDKDEYYKIIRNNNDDRKKKRIQEKRNNNIKRKEIQVKRNNNDVFEEIRKYKQLYDEGAITEEEFRLKKKKLMDI